MFKLNNTKADTNLMNRGVMMKVDLVGGHCHLMLKVEQICFKTLL